MEKSYRIRTEVGKDQVIHAHLKQDIDFLEVLSLKIKQEDTYRLHTSNYGIIVGRVLANEAFGIQNAKVSVFIPISDEDSKDSDIFNLYPYSSLQSLDSDNRRYNLLPSESNDDCYKVVGSFPNKRLILDNDIEIEIYEKYWKYTTVTNQSGDYMIFGVPKGNQQVHIDIDLSDIGILSQKPRDFVYKGYNIEQFDNSSQFKDSTNLDSLTQLFSQNNSVYVYPFWGETDIEEVAITRCDVQIQYKFEPTCVFMGSIISDNYSNSINHKCNASKSCGFNRNLVCGEGTIEMIRKTVDGTIEEFPIQGNRLIDGNGVWCYQIPMNLDYVGTDEFGNIIPTDNPNKGIATRTSVRFRVSMQETENDGLSRHRAKYLVPNNFEIISNDKLEPTLENSKDYDLCYNFGSATPDEYFRDLYWNKVYTVKNYIPRIQKNQKSTTQKYSAIRTVNDSGNLNPFPFNHARFRLVFAYRILCIITNIVIDVVSIINSILGGLACFSVVLIEKNTLDFWKIEWPKNDIKLEPFKWLCGELIHCIALDQGLSEEEDSDTIYIPGCNGSGKNNDETCTSCIPKKYSGSEYETDTQYIKDQAQLLLSQEYDVVNMDFYNDWVNGVLYFPLWFLKQRKKKSYLWGLIKTKGSVKFCDCDEEYKRLRIAETCSLSYGKTYNIPKSTIDGNSYHKDVNTKKTVFGIIKEFTNKLGKKIYYYSPGKPTDKNYLKKDETNFVRLYSTDIVLLGSLNECDLDGLPRPYINLPSTTANVPFMSYITDEEDNDTIEMTGMDWGSTNILERIKAKLNGESISNNKGLFMDLGCNKITTAHKTCVNLQRISELGVSLDTTVNNLVPTQTTSVFSEYEILPDGMITRYEITDNETRSMFASLNHNGLTKKIFNDNTGYDKYDLKYKYPTDFDGHMSYYSSEYTKDYNSKTYDNRNEEYIKYKFGELNNSTNYLFYNKSSNTFNMPLFNNSFYFYFGLNEGNTAIDKFNKLFYSTCYKKEKFPFSLTYEVTPKPWCGDGSAEIYVKLTGIKIPYSYVLYMNNNMLNQDNGIVNKNFKISKNINNEPLENGIYTLEIIDSLGQTVSQDIPIKPIFINLNSSYSNLAIEYDEFNDNLETLKTFDGYGYIDLESFNINDEEYSIKNIEQLPTTFSRDYNDFGNFYIDVYKEDIEYKILLNIKVYCEYQKADELLNNFIDISEFNSDKKRIKFYKPSYIQITSTLLCNSNENDYYETLNISTNSYYINNGEKFIGLLNNVPIEYIKDFDKNYSLYSNYSSYNFPNLDEKGYKSYSNHINFNNDYNNGIDDTDKFKIIKFKLESIFNLSKGTIITDNNPVTVKLSHKGGKSPIVYRNVCPNYSIFDGINNVNSYLYEDYGQITCPENGANFISEKYTKYDSEYNINLSYSGETNPFYNENSYNGFALYTNGGESPRIAIPNTILGNVSKTTSSATWNSIASISGVSNFKKIYFFDKRFDYDYEIIINHSDASSTPTISGNCYGGIKMHFDESKNIIGENLSYYYDNDGNITINSGGTFYDSQIKINNNEYINVMSGYNYENKSFSYKFPSDITKYERLDYFQQSCSYDISLTNESNVIKGIIKPSQKVEFSLDLTNKLLAKHYDLENNEYGIIYGDNVTNDKSAVIGLITSSVDMTFKFIRCKQLLFSFDDDSFNTTHNTITSVPKKGDYDLATYNRGTYIKDSDLSEFLFNNKKLSYLISSSDGIIYDKNNYCQFKTSAFVSGETLDISYTRCYLPKNNNNLLNKIVVNHKIKYDIYDSIKFNIKYVGGNLRSYYTFKLQDPTNIILKEWALSGSTNITEFNTINNNEFNINSLVINQYKELDNPNVRVNLLLNTNLLNFIIQLQFTTGQEQPNPDKDIII